MSRTRLITTALAALLLAGPAAYAVDLPSFPGSDTKLSVYGFIRPTFAYQFDGRQTSIYTGSLLENIPANQGSGISPLDTHNMPNDNILFGVKASELGFATVTPSDTLGDVKTILEFDLNNAYADHMGLRHCAIQFSGWTFGQYWSLWNDLSSWGDTVDWAGPYGSSVYSWSRVLTIQKEFKLDKNNTIAFGLDQPEDLFGGGSAEVGSPTSAASTGTADNRIPTVLAAYTYSDTWGHVEVVGLGQNYSAYIPATPTTGSTRYNKMEYAGKITAEVKLTKVDDLNLSFMYGSAIGGYGLAMQSALLVDSTQSVYAYKNNSWMVDYTHNWTDKVRTNLIVSGFSFTDNPTIDAIMPVQPNTQSGNPVNNGVKSGYNAYVNAWIKLTKNMELGLEYEYEQVKPFSSNGPGITVNSNDQPASNNSASQIQLGLHCNF
jgi:hypothetical protein